MYNTLSVDVFALYSLLLLSFFLYLKSVPIHVIVHVHVQYTSKKTFQTVPFKRR